MPSGTTVPAVMTDTEKVMREIRNVVNAREQAHHELTKAARDVVTATEDLKKQFMNLAAQGTALETVVSQYTQWTNNTARPLEDRKQALRLYCEAIHLKIDEFKRTYPGGLLNVLEGQLKDLKNTYERESKEAEEIEARIDDIEEEIEALKPAAGKGSRRVTARAASK